MAGPFAVDLARLEMTIADIARLDALLEAKLADVDARVRQLQPVWTGPAADAAHTAHTEWLAGAAEMRTALVALRAAAADAEGRYQAALTANQSNWGR
jgi:WXG100 family type VII secretion target